jgi:transcription-repair coupling factor (superfamily II helicase)
MDLSVHAFLPAGYIPSEELRILSYKKLVAAETPAALGFVQAELEDRFGPLPGEAKTLLEVSALRIVARDIGIEGIIQKPSSLEIRFLANTSVPPQTILQLALDRTGLHFKPGPPFTLSVDRQAFESPGPIHYLQDLLAACSQNDIVRE